MEPTTPPPAKWHESPLLKYAVGVLVSVLLGLIASKWGITPQPVPAPLTPGVLVLNVSPTPAAPAAPIQVAGK